jgi:hypothetical protein
MSWRIAADALVSAANRSMPRLASHRQGDLRDLLTMLRQGQRPTGAFLATTTSKLRGLAANDSEVSDRARRLAGECLAILDSDAAASPPAAD